MTSPDPLDDAASQVDPFREDQLEEIRDSYEAALLSGESPTFEEYLKAAPAECRKPLLSELVSVAFYYFRRCGVRDVDSLLLSNAVELDEDLRAQIREVSQTLKDPKGSIANDEAAVSANLPAQTSRQVGPTTCGPLGQDLQTSTEETQAHEFTPIANLGHYQLIEKMGAGGFGTVWKAFDSRLERIVALKLPREHRIGPEYEDQLLAEARNAARLKHPSIVTIHDASTIDGTPYIASEFVQGVSLEEWLKHYKPSLRQSIQLCIDVAGALHYAHERGIVHRDLKPGNIMLDDDGRPCIVDFGLALRTKRPDSSTRRMGIFGTPAYMSPEQGRGYADECDARSDIYSLGVVLYELITGERPFRGDSVRIVIHNILTKDPSDPRELNSRVPRDLSTICLKCLQKKPGSRYSSALELQEDLQRFMNGEPIHARREGAASRLVRGILRSDDGAVVAAGLYSLTLSLLLIAWAIFGMALFATGIQPVENPMRAIVQLMGMCCLLYLPLFFIGTQTLNKSRLACYGGVVFFLIGTAIAVAVLSGHLTQLEMMVEARSNQYVQYEMGSLFTIVCLAGLTLHLRASYRRAPRIDLPTR